MALSGARDRQLCVLVSEDVNVSAGESKRSSAYPKARQNVLCEAVQRARAASGERDAVATVTAAMAIQHPSYT